MKKACLSVCPSIRLKEESSRCFVGEPEAEPFEFAADFSAVAVKDDAAAVV